MKTKIKNIILIIIAIIGIAIITYLCTKNEKISIIIEETKTATNNTIAGNYIAVQREVSVGTKLWRPILVNGKVAYCIQPGAPLNGLDSHPTKEAIYSNIPRETSKSCGHARNPGSNPYYNVWSAYYLVPSGEKAYCQDDSYSDSGNVPGRYVENLYDVGYILSFVDRFKTHYNDEEWSGAVQGAIWRSGVSIVDFDKSGKSAALYSGFGSYIYKEATEYKEFYQKIVAREGSSQVNPEMNPIDKTERDTNGNAKVTVNTDKETGLVTVGPFKVDYVQGSTDGKLVSFSGISDMYLIDEVGNKINIEKLITEKEHTIYVERKEGINYEPGTNEPPISDEEYNNYVKCKWNYINGIYADNMTFETYMTNYSNITPKKIKEGKPNYFSLSSMKNYEYSKQYITDNNQWGTNNKEDYWDFMRFYPDSEEEFYVSYYPEKQNTEGKTGETVGSVKLHVDFTWLRCTGSFVTRNTEHYCVRLGHNDYIHYHGFRRCFDCEKWNYIDKESGQKCLVVLNGNRELITKPLEISYNDQTIDTTMKLGGYVFTDEVGENKESLADGRITNTDIFMPNVTVTLYEKGTDGNYIEAKCKTLLATKISISGLNDEDKNLYQYNTTESIKIAKKYQNDLAANLVKVVGDDTDLKDLQNEIFELSKEISEKQSEIEKLIEKRKIEVTNTDGSKSFRDIDAIIESLEKQLENKKEKLNEYEKAFKKSDLKNLNFKDKEAFKNYSESYINNYINMKKLNDLYDETKIDQDLIDNYVQKVDEFEGIIKQTWCVIFDEKQEENERINEWNDLLNTYIKQDCPNNEKDALKESLRQLAYKYVKEDWNEIVSKYINNSNPTEKELESLLQYAYQYQINILNEEITELKQQISAQNSLKDEIEEQKETAENYIKDKESIINAKNAIILKSIESSGKYKEYISKFNEYNAIVNAISEAENESDYTRRLNSTLTDSNGYYEFRGLITTKDYIVRFTYNGQDYMPTDYLKNSKNKYNSVSEMVNAEPNSLYNTTEWAEVSKGTEYANTRIEYDNKFAEIGSSPHNYITTNSLGFFKPDENIYNETYTELELMGYILGEDGKYSQTGIQLVDGFEKDENGYDEYTKEGSKIYKEGIITIKIRDFIRDYKRYPTTEELKNIYSDIAKTNIVLQKQIQFIEDCKMTSWTKNMSEKLDNYAALKLFTTENEDVKVEGVLYKTIYPGQLEINQGLWKRQEDDISLRKDVYKSTLKINGKTEVYNYDKRNSDDEKLWEINVRMSDYDAYYGSGYTRELYKADYNIVSNNTISNKLDIYITYKITIKNQSQSIVVQIPEVVDYFDKDYIYRDDLSWIMYEAESTITNEEFYYMMSQDSDFSNNKTESGYGKNYKKTLGDKAKDTNSREGASRYGEQTRSDLINSNYNDVYIKGLEDKKLLSGERAYIYLTFQVKTDKEGYLLVENDKKNIVEINGYKTFYRDETELPNNITKGSNDVAGLIDIDSNPGNLTNSDIQGNKYEKNFEDDTDRAKGLKLNVTDDIRQINGTAWEDTRDTKSDLAQIGDGDGKDEKNNNKKIAGVTVRLYEVEDTENTIIDKYNVSTGVNGKTKENPTKIFNGNAWKDAVTTTQSDGSYKFEGYIPGNYIVRFDYGDTDTTTLSNDTTNNEVAALGLLGSNKVSYNGQDYKTTTYQAGIDNGITDYINTTESCTYAYNIAQADLKPNISDAKDIMSRREQVEKYSNTDVTNALAEILVSPYRIPTYTDVNGETTPYGKIKMRELIDILKKNTQMTAETGVIKVDVEYNRNAATDGYDNLSNLKEEQYDSSIMNNYKNGNFILYNVDIGLVERPKAQLKTTKQITNVQVTLANGTVLFDATSNATNVLWRDHDAHGLDTNNEYTTSNNYASELLGINQINVMKQPIVRKEPTKKGLIQLTMDEELMHGATIKITYAITIANIGEVNYESNEFYYSGKKAKSDTIVTTTVNQIIDYVGNQTTDDGKATKNNLQFMAADNIEWTVIKSDDLLKNSYEQSDKDKKISNQLLNENLKENAEQYNTIVTYKFNKALIPIIADEDKATTICNAFKSSPLTAVEEVVNKTESVVGTQLVLSQVITSDNASDDMTYNNMVEIVKTGNTAGRRMAYSVVGNQNPLTPVAEIDADSSQQVTILPPFGQHYIYYILGSVIAVIMIGGIFIIRKILKK